MIDGGLTTACSGRASRAVDAEGWSARAALMADVEINETLPKMDASSAVFPTARVVGDSLVVAYHLPGCGASAVIRFHGVKDWAYGYPNDEGLHEHPLWGKGLTFYEFHKIESADGDVAQWIGTFHDGTLTVRAKSVETVDERVASKPWEAIDARFGEGANQVIDEM